MYCQYPGCAKLAKVAATVEWVGSEEKREEWFCTEHSNKLASKIFSERTLTRKDKADYKARYGG